MTISLPGFTTVKREAVEVSGAGVITLNADMRVGDVQETITVTGETPIVDVQSTRRQQVIDDSTLNALPATRGYNALIFLVPSVTGGSNQIDLMPAMRIFYSHGGRGNEGRTYVDGLSTGLGVQRRRRVGLHHRHRQLAGNAADAVGRPWRERSRRHAGQLRPEDRRQHLLGSGLLQHRG